MSSSRPLVNNGQWIYQSDAANRRANDGISCNMLFWLVDLTSQKLENPLCITSYTMHMEIKPYILLW